MAIAGAPDSCTDANSSPEPYGIVERMDSEIWGQIKTLAGKINAISRELKPIVNRLGRLEAAEEPLSEDAAAKLSSLQVERAHLEERLAPLRKEHAHLLRKVRLVTLRRQCAANIRRSFRKFFGVLLQPPVLPIQAQKMDVGTPFGQRHQVNYDRSHVVPDENRHGWKTVLHGSPSALAIGRQTELTVVPSNGAEWKREMGKREIRCLFVACPARQT